MQIFSQHCVLVWVPEVITLWAGGPFTRGDLLLLPPLHFLLSGSLPVSRCTSWTLSFLLFAFLHLLTGLYENLLKLVIYLIFPIFFFSCLTFLFHSLCLLCLSFLEHHFQFSSSSTAVSPSTFLLFWCPSSLLKASILALEWEDTWQQAADTSGGSCQVQGQLTVHTGISASHPGLACPPAFWAPDQVSLQPPPVTHGAWGPGSHPPLNLQTPWVWGKCTAGEWLLLQTLKPHTGASLVAQMVNDLSTVLATWVRSPGQEDPLEKGMATHCSIPAWNIPWTEEPGGL